MAFCGLFIVFSNAEIWVSIFLLGCVCCFFCFEVIKSLWHDIALLFIFLCSTDRPWIQFFRSCNHVLLVSILLFVLLFELVAFYLPVHVSLGLYHWLTDLGSPNCLLAGLGLLLAVGFCTEFQHNKLFSMVYRLSLEVLFCFS